MGTNYYAVFNACPHCKAGEREHIGKSSLGWEFSFHGTESIRMWSTWKERLSEPDTLIEDEYGSEISYQDFVTKVEASKGKTNTVDYLHQEGRTELFSGYNRYWKDPEGWSFFNGEFT